MIPKESPAHPAPADLSFLVISHAVIQGNRDVFGPAHNVVEHLNLRGHDVDFLLHPLDGTLTGIERSFRRGELVRERTTGYRTRRREVLFNLRRLRESDANVAVLIDPLNYLAVTLVRRRHHVRVYYTADFSERRFEHLVMNAVYHRLDRRAVRHADVVWSVSKRIAARRSAQGVQEADNIVIPNAPPLDPDAVVPWPERSSESAVFAGMLDPIFDSQLLVKALVLLAPGRPQLRVRLVGDGPDRISLREQIERRGLGRHVEFCGYLPHDAALATIATCRVGLALYSGAASWNEYGDSLKVREYLSRGVPVVSTPRHPLAAELEERGAGYVVESPAQAASAIATILEDTAGDASRRALAMAQEADRTAVLDSALADLQRRVHAANR